MIKHVCSEVFQVLFLKTRLFLVDAYENARNLCDRYYMNSPELVLEEFNGNCNYVLCVYVTVSPLLILSSFNYVINE